VALIYTRHRAGSRRTRSAFVVAAVLLGFYVAMYLAVVGVVHILASPDAFAGGFVPEAPASASGAAASAPHNPSPKGLPCTDQLI
jgi:hypothetical protein